MLAGCGGDAAQPDAPPAEVGVVVLKAEPVTLTTELPGRVSAFETSEVRSQVNGIIRRRYFTEGSYVKQGALLYQIDDAPYCAALEFARGHYARAKATIKATRQQYQRSIGTASCWERVCQSLQLSGGGESLKKKIKKVN